MIVKEIFTDERGRKKWRNYSDEGKYISNGQDGGKYEEAVDVIEKTYTELDEYIDTQPATSQIISRVADLEDGLMEVADVSANNEVSIGDLNDAVMELAELIGGE